MRLYRIGRQAYLEDYRGLGASYLDGGRWNAAGVPALYFAETASVAMLEMANYLPSPRLGAMAIRLVDVQANIYNPRAFGGAPGATGR